MKQIKENLSEIGFFIIVMMLLLYVAVTPNQDVEMRKEVLRLEHLKDSLEMEYYKKELKSYPNDHSEIKDTTKQNINTKTSF
jgi:hypothetical protein